MSEMTPERIAELRRMAGPRALVRSVDVRLLDRIIWECTDALEAANARIAELEAALAGYRATTTPGPTRIVNTGGIDDEW